MKNVINRQSLVFIVLTTAFASCISMIGGIGIELVQADLFVIVPLVIAMPALNTMVGSYATIIAAHAGSPGEQKITRKKLIVAIFKSTIVNMLGTVTFSLFLATRQGFDITLMFLLIFSGFVVISIASIVSAIFLITYSLDKLLTNRKLNPDEVLIPVVTTITDVFMLGMIALAAKFLF